MSAISDPLAIALMQILYLTALYGPLRGFGRVLPRGTRLGMSYLAGNFLALGLSYALGVAGCFTAMRAFWLWAGVCGALNLWAWRRFRSPWRPLRAEMRVHALLAVILAATVVVRLADPLRNAALSGTDSYQFVNYYAWILGEDLSIHDYPSGFALATALAPWRIQPYAAARWAPHLVFLASLAAAFGLWRRIGGTRFSLVFSLLIGTAWFLYPITACHPHFIQWTMFFVALPALLFLYARLRQRRAGAAFLFLGVAVNVTFAMTAAYFALYLNVALWALVCADVVWRKRRLPTDEAGVGAGWAPRSRFPEKIGVLAAVSALAAAVPLTLLFYYGVLARRFFPYWSSGIVEQSEMVVAVVEGQALSPLKSLGCERLAHPLLQVAAVFLAPAWPLRAGPRWVVYGILLALAVRLWRQGGRRNDAMRLAAGVMAISAFSAMTGIFELPAWQGRNVFVALYAGLVAGLWTTLRLRPRMTRRLFRSRVALLAGFCLVAGPALVYPPEIGRNVLVSAAIRPRVLPEDNDVMEELLRAPDRSGVKKRLSVAPPRGPTACSDLISSLLRLHYPHPRRHALPGYSIVRTRNPQHMYKGDAALIPAGRQEEYPLPDHFVVHTRGRDYVFAVRAE